MSRWRRASACTKRAAGAEADRYFFVQLFKGNAVSDLKARFEAAVANSKTLSERPDNATLLKLYALYK